MVNLKEFKPFIQIIGFLRPEPFLFRFFALGHVGFFDRDPKSKKSVYKSVSFRGPQFGPHKTDTFFKKIKKIEIKDK